MKDKHICFHSKALVCRIHRRYPLANTKNYQEKFWFARWKYRFIILLSMHIPITWILSNLMSSLVSVCIAAHCQKNKAFLRIIEWKERAFWKQCLRGLWGMTDGQRACLPMAPRNTCLFLSGMFCVFSEQLFYYPWESWYSLIPDKQGSGQILGKGNCFPLSVCRPSGDRRANG